MKAITKIINNRKIKIPEIRRFFHVCHKVFFHATIKLSKIRKESIWDFRVKKHIVSIMQALGVQAKLTLISKFHVLVVKTKHVAL